MLPAEEETFIDVDENKKTVKGLHQKIEVLKTNYLELESKFYELRSQVRTNDIKDLQKLQDELEEVKMNLSKRDRELEDVRKNSEGTDKVISNLKDRLRDSEEQLKTVVEGHEKRLELLSGITSVLTGEFQIVKNNIDMYSHLFK